MGANEENSVRRCKSADSSMYLADRVADNLDGDNESQSATSCATHDEATS